MDKKLSDKKENVAAVKVSGLSARAFAVVKFILGVCLLPFVYASTVAFLSEFSTVDKAAQNYFWSGVLVFILIHLIIWEPAIFYLKGQKILEAIFSFFRPLVRVAPYLLPIYVVILFIIYIFSQFIFKSVLLTKYIIFLIGFNMALHIVFSARTLRSKQGDLLKANYLFGFSLIYIINIFLLAFCYNVIFNNFSIFDFISQVSRLSSDIFYTVFKQLFVQ